MRIQAGSGKEAPDRFLMVLNGHLAFANGFVEMERVPVPSSLQFALRSKDEGLDQEVSEGYVTRIRQLVDMWIETGRDGIGEGENPFERKMSKPLYEVLNDWASRNPPDISFDDAGNTVVWMPARKMDFPSPMNAAMEDATRFFASFLDTPYRYRLCKCRSCSAYYYTERLPHGFIKNGTYCSQHRHIASAKRSNERTRLAEHNRKIELAVKFWGKWPKRLTEKKAQAQWVAEQINDELEHNYKPIRVNWVTRYKAEVQETIAHAKS